MPSDDQTVEDLAGLGYSVREMLEAGITANEILDAIRGGTVRVVDGEEQVLRLLDLVEGGVTITELRDMDVPAEELVGGGVHPNDVKDVYGDFTKTMTDKVLIAAGYDPLLVKYQEYFAKFYSQRGSKCVCGGINNSVGKGIMPMPQKFYPSADGNGFSQGRKAFIKGVPDNFNYRNYELDKLLDGKPTARGMPLTHHSASSVVQVRRIAALGKSSTKSGLPEGSSLSFCASNRANANTVRQARRRTRSSGAVVPPKVYTRQVCCATNACPTIPNTR
jgi:hypothetical protein